MKKTYLAAAALAVALGAVAFIPRGAASQPMSPASAGLLLGVGDRAGFSRAAAAGMIARAGVACPPGIYGGIYGNAAGKGSGEHPVGCIVFQR